MQNDSYRPCDEMEYEWDSAPVSLRPSNVFCISFVLFRLFVVRPDLKLSLSFLCLFFVELFRCCPVRFHACVAFQAGFHACAERTGITKHSKQAHQNKTGRQAQLVKFIRLHDLFFLCQTL
jgi:hypothetical protein